MLKLKYWAGVSLLTITFFGFQTAFSAVLVPAGSVWKYLDDGSNQSNAWQTIEFEDDGWESGPAQLGYGDGDEATIVSFGTNANSKFITTYFRHVFEVADLTGITNVTVRLQRDDGGIVYLNGVEIFRSNMPNGPVNYLTPASTAAGGTNSTFFFSTNVPLSLVLTGRNLLAVEVHQNSGSSSDLSFDLELFAAGDNEPPTVAISNPKNNAFVPAPSDMMLSADAGDIDGTVTRVEFYQGNLKLGEVTNAPFSLMWSNVLPGAYTLYAIAADNRGLITKSLGSKVLIGGGGASNLVLLPAGSEWRYLDTGVAPGTDWRQSDFDDGLWKSGSGQFGYGDSDEVTRVSFGPDSNNKFVTTYFRTTFVVGDTSAIPTLVIRFLRDDGGIVYINGLEAFRSNMPGGVVSNGTFAATTLGTPEEATFVRSLANRRLLVNGTNVIAVEVHQSTTNSSDLSFDLELLGSDIPGVVRGPYLQRGTPNSVVVRWRTDAPSNSRVTYGTNAADLDRAATNLAIIAEHTVTLTGLSPDTTYFYSIGTTATNLLGGLDFQFTTAPPRGTPKPTRVWAIGDSGTANVDAQNVRDAHYRFAPSRAPDLWLMLGDNAYNDGDDDEYQAAVFDTYPATLRKTVLWPTIGNHDTDQLADPLPTIPYYQIFTLPTAGEAGGVASGTEDYYAFDYGNIHFVCLDAMTSARTPGSPMLTWVQNDLNSTTQEWVIAFWHHPPYSKGSHDSDTSARQTEIRQFIVPILESNGVDLVLCGHSHAYERSYLIHGHYGLSPSFNDSMKRNPGNGREDEDGVYQKPTGAPGEGTVYIVAGSSGKVSGGLLNHPAMVLSLNRLGSLILDIDGHRLDVKFVRENGLVQDYFTMIKGPLAPTLTIARSEAADDVIRWSTNYGPVFTLESAAEITGDWSEVPSPRLRSGNQYVVTNTPASPRLFYRLRRPSE
ncbi:MAG: metallophosphoesterase [Verrucomicrobia subdivision 3 bacterium]|nr:metallophosphoesterase [Limisphaerales bacterium]